MNAQTPIKLAPIDIFDPSSYPTRRDEEWHYSDLSRALREAPAKPPLAKALIPPLEGDGVSYEYSGTGGGGIHSSEFYSGRAELCHGGGWDWDDAAIGTQIQERIVIDPGQSLILYEIYDGGGHYAAHSTLHFKLGEGASLTRVVIMDEPDRATSIRRSTVETAPNSVFKQYVFSTGAGFQRFETHVNHVGQGAEVELNGAYLLKDKTHFDYTTRITHAGRDGITRQLIKGLVKDQATGVFQGRILVERGADGTDARMHHQALMLNDGAHVRAKPELEIYADDVQCAHGNTIGALDETALFFCQSRGMPEAVARALLTQAFVLPVAEMIEDEALREKVLTFLTEKAEVFHGL